MCTVYRIESSQQVNQLILDDAEYGAWVLNVIRRFREGKYGNLLMLSDQETMSVYYAPRYEGNLCIATDHVGERTTLMLNSERIARA